SNKAVLLEDLKKMTKTLVHRGPDDEGFFISRQLGFGFRRLSIIDLRNGHQPMSDAGKKVWVVFNGEIYNFKEIKKVLMGFGHTFYTKSDTEVIIYGYKQWGIDVLNHLNGMFGFAIWDDVAQRLILARDRMGIKNIYYKADPQRVAFGSEIRAIRAYSEEKPKVDIIALNLFLRYRYTPSPLTLIDGVKKLAPGTCLIVENGKVSVKRWWNFQPVPFDPMPSEREVENDLLMLYREAVRRQLISDVPLGLLLSGGMDSGLLLALMKKEKNICKTYTVGYGKTYKQDELHKANRTAAVLGANHSAVEINKEQFQKSLPKIIACLEEPVATSSIVPMYHVCERARQDVKVALVGQGPDELFGGYKRHIGVVYGKYWRAMPSCFRVFLKSLLAPLPRAESIKRGLYSLDNTDRLQRYKHVFSIVSEDSINRMFRKELFTANIDDEIFKCWDDLIPLMGHTDELGGLNFLEVRSSLPDELLMYTDKLSMAHGLEIRVPFLDHAIVEYVERLGSSFKVNKGERKWIHRKICRRFLPEDIVNRRKIGFATKVVDAWFQKSFFNKKNDLLFDEQSLLYQYISYDAVNTLLQEHENKRQDNHKILFSLVVLEEWLRNLQ
ncbi:MAG: asparagine synthase (glutamine-hydrolyzing), partial [Deltaproteobacteria bacterium]|nr:asparagine synthase (glutamine-hydrolyzing) [Deltaproteobacteria bacterium]